MNSFSYVTIMPSNSCYDLVHFISRANPDTADCMTSCGQFFAATVINLTTLQTLSGINHFLLGYYPKQDDSSVGNIYRSIDSTEVVTLINLGPHLFPPLTL